MKEYLRERQKKETAANTIGIALAVSAHVIACAAFSWTGIKYIYPPPEETTFLIDYTEEQVIPKQNFKGRQPQAKDIDRTKSIELVQKSESPYKAISKKSETPATRPDDFGDIDTPTVEQEKALDPRAAFPGMSKKDTSLTAPHSADESKAKYKAGQPTGNTTSGVTSGTPNAHVKGRNTVGALPKPGYNVQNEGIVVVSIWVDNYGKVVKAQPGADGTTVTDARLWAEARKAALGTTFNRNIEAPSMQEGTITYIFKLK